jgi:hypothetical protein
VTLTAKPRSQEAKKERPKVIAATPNRKIGTWQRDFLVAREEIAATASNADLVAARPDFRRISITLPAADHLPRR